MATARRLPEYAAEGPLHLVMLRFGLDADDPRDVLLAAAYQLAARLERRTAPWDGQGADLIGASHFAHLAAGPCSVHLVARVGRYDERAGMAR